MAKIKGTKDNNILQGTSLSDTIFGLAGDDKLFGRGGDDALYGGAGNDTMYGGAGNDTIHVDGGADVVRAGSGDDIIIISGQASAKINTGAGRDEVQIGKSALGSAMLLEDGNDTVSIAVSALENQTYRINAGSGVDIIDFAGKLSLYTVSKSSSGVQTVTDKHGNSYIISNADTLTFAGIPYTEPTNPPNVAPVVAHAIADKVADEDAAFSFQIPSNTFSDANGDTLTYTVTDGDGNALPSWLNFNASTGTFSGTPTNDDVASIIVVVTASDGDASVSESFKLTVNNSNDAPTGTATATLAAGTEDMSYVVSEKSLLKGFSDLDGDSLSVADLTASNGATVTDNGDGTWTVKPAAPPTRSATPMVIR
jgi:hypothetical protein